MSPKTTPKQRRFAEEYLVDLNAKQAAIRAGYSARTAKEQAHQLLAKPQVQALIQNAQRARSERTQIDADWLLRRLADQADANLADLFNADGSMKAVVDWPEVWRKGLVAGVEVFEEFAGTGKDRVQVGWVRKVKLVDRLKGLELIGRHVVVGAFRDKVEHSGPAGGPIPVAMNAEEFRAIAAELASKV